MTEDTRSLTLVRFGEFRKGDTLLVGGCGRRLSAWAYGDAEEHAVSCSCCGRVTLHGATYRVELRTTLPADLSET